MTDAEGSVLTSLSASTVLGEQIYGPYGNQRYTQGSMGTDKGYTGQFQDAATGLDYYNARYYDPVMGQFLSADVKQGNAQGFDPYSYVNGNPETATDPTGQAGVCAWCSETGIAGGSTAASGKYPTIPTCARGHVVTGTSCTPEAHTKPTTAPSTGSPCGGCDIATIQQDPAGPSVPAKKSAPALPKGCGDITNGWKALEAGGEIAANLTGWLALLAAVVATDGVGFLTLVTGMGANLLHGILDGVENMIASFQDHNPWIDAIIDGLKVILDIASYFGPGTNLSKIGDTVKNFATIVVLFGSALGAVISDKSVNRAGNIGKAGSNLDTISQKISAGVQIGGDLIQLFQDIGAANQYWNEHSCCE